jgi:hypothetical protein
MSLGTRRVSRSSEWKSLGGTENACGSRQGADQRSEMLLLDEPMGEPHVALGLVRGQIVENDMDMAVPIGGPPENAIVLAVDEKPSIQALERVQGYLKLPNGRSLTAGWTTIRKIFPLSAVLSQEKYSQKYSYRIPRI